MLRRFNSILRSASCPWHGPPAEFLGRGARPFKFSNLVVATFLHDVQEYRRFSGCHALSTMASSCELITADKLSELLLHRITSTVEHNRLALQVFDDAVLAAGDDEDALSHIPLPRRRATLVFSDVDGTLKVSHGTNAQSLVCFDVRRAIMSINGVDNSIFFVPATGRDIELVDSVFPGLRLPTIADDGGYIRYPSGHSVSYPLPPIEEFRRLGSGIVNRGQATEIKLGNAYGLSYSEMSTYFAADAESFRALALERDDITVYTHKYPGSQEIIVQDGRHTKGTAVREVVREFKNNGFDEVDVISAGDSSNDESHFRAINELGGVSVRIKYKQDTAAKYYVPSLEVWQNAIIATSRELVRLGIAADDVFEDIADVEPDEETSTDEQASNSLNSVGVPEDNSDDDASPRARH